MNIRVLIALCTVSIVSWLLCVGLISSDHSGLEKHDKDARAYLRKALPKIVANWNYNHWRARAASELKMSTNQPKLKKDFVVYRRTLGEYKRMEEPYGNISYQDVYGERIMVGAYTCRVHYKNAMANLVVRVVRRGGGWKFQMFAVRSEMLD